MAARKKPDSEKYTVILPLRTTQKMREDLNEMADQKGISISDIARRCFSEELRIWEQSKSSADKAEIVE